MRRFLYAWPPSHDLLHSAHSDQRLILQGVLSACASGQPMVSRTASVQGSPPKAAACWTSRVRYFCTPPKRPQPLQSDHAPKRQGFVSPHACSLQVLVLRVEPSHGFPPRLAGVSNRRICVCQPPPQDVLHSVQAPHSENAQSTAGLSPHGVVSFMAPLHSLPPSRDGLWMVRERAFCAVKSPLHSLHALQSEKRQSSGVFMHSGFGHDFVSCFKPEQGVPHSLLVTAICRWRKQTPVQPPASNHSSHSPKAQSTGWHS
mmetsp:Transcript_98265/g.286562  ORF Transcript_98265/g.286562 Transcript_98265/m.286562 type:complete len:259 (+) Transcript_98265:2689-3465(+)